MTELNSVTEDVLTYIRSKYYVFTKDIYRAYSFNQTLLDSLDGYGGIILDAEILKNAAVQPIIDILNKEGIDVVNDLSIYVF